MSDLGEQGQDLTDREAAILAAVGEHYARYGVPPTLHRIAEVAMIRNTAAVGGLLDSLAAKGLLLVVDPPGGSRKYLPRASVHLGAPVRLAGPLRRVAAELRARAAELEQLASELEGGDRHE
jgi:LexA DNA binding domain